MEDENKQKENYSRGFGLGLFFKLSSWIVTPILGAVIIGRWLDKKYKTDPWLFLGAIAVAFIISVCGMIKDALAELKRIESEEGKKKK